MAAPTGLMNLLGLLLLGAGRACEEGSCGDFLQVDLAMRALHPEAHSEHPWPHARGKVPGQFGTTDNVLSLPGGLAANWSWHNPEGKWTDMVAGGPVIDSDKNLYLMTMNGLWKFSPSGEVLWRYETPGKSDNEPYLTGDVLMSSTVKGNVFAVDRHTGKELWVTHVADRGGGDAAYPASMNDVFVVASDKWLGSGETLPGGNMKIFGLAVGSGEKLWEYDSDHPVWNLTPLFPDDETFVFMSKDGSVYRLGLQNGTMLWKADANNSLSFSDGGAVIGPNGLIYTCSNMKDGKKGTPGVVRAFGLEKGNLVWEHLLPEPCCTFPAVGHVKGADSLAVVVTPGAFPGELGEAGSVLALDAETGKPLWEFNAEKYYSPLAVGDADRLLYEVVHPQSVGRMIRQLCLPAQWSSPTITGDGSVFVGRYDGKLYVVHGNLTGDEVGELTKDPVTGVHALVQFVGSAPVHGALSFADGMLGYATCDSLYVWQAPSSQ